MALDSTLAYQGGIYVAANSSCCAYINTSLEVETSIDNIRQQATWLQQTLLRYTPVPERMELVHIHLPLDTIGT